MTEESDRNGVRWAPLERGELALRNPSEQIVVSASTWSAAEQHRHSGIGMHTPIDVHYGRATAVQEHRASVLTSAYAAHPERFVRHPPLPPPLATTAWINQPTETPNSTITTTN